MGATTLKADFWFRKTTRPAGLLPLSIVLSSAALAQAENCSIVTTATLNIAGTVITGNKFNEAEEDLPRHCVLAGKVNERTGVDGKTYAIQCEMQLQAGPATACGWVGRLCK